MITRTHLQGCKVYICGYCELQHLFNFCGSYKLGYNAGVYGWNYDAYKIDDIIIATGYRTPKGKRIDRELTSAIDEKARHIARTYAYDEGKAEIEKLVKELLEALK